jgi:hypothetical protein
MYISLVTQAVPRKNYEYIKNIQFGLMTRIGCRGSDGCLIYDRVSNDYYYTLSIGTFIS